MILSCQEISKSFGENDILEDISFQAEEGDKIAIVGNNGTGKTTLLRILTGELRPDTGRVVMAKNTTMGYLAQYQNETQEGCIYDIVHSARTDILTLKERLEEMEKEMTTQTGAALEQLLEKYHRVHDTFDHLEGYSYDSLVHGVLQGLGFTEEDFTKTMPMLSGGQKTRVSLGKLLVMRPDILLLDEPINHLDLSSIQWLENFLMNYKGTVILVAHDRYFLDRIVSKVYDLSRRQVHLYRGNYSAFARQKAQLQKTRLREYEKQQQQIAHQQEVIDKLRQFNREKSIRRADSRQKALDKTKIIEAPLQQQRTMQLMLEPECQSGKDVMEIKNLSKAYDGIPLFSGFDFFLRRGEHVAILGDNGTGKTTLLKLINKKIPADDGTIRLGANVSIGYYDQEQQALDDKKTLFEEMQDAYPQLSNTRIRNVLAAFLFVGDDCFKKIKDLSGGERGRISLAKLMLSGANFLILDEPTNHLDMESKEILEDALNAYPGTLLYVSHDRYFINKTAHKILELAQGTFREYPGNYDDYCVQKTKQPSDADKRAEEEEPDASESLGKEDWEQQKRQQSRQRKLMNRLSQCEEQIQELEQKLALVLEEFSKDEVATNSARLNELSLQQQKIQKQVDALYEEWEALSEALS